MPIVNAFHYRMTDFIQAELAPDERVQYRNRGQIRLTGIESEVSGSPLPWLDAAVSAVVQKSDDLARASRRRIRFQSETRGNCGGSLRAHSATKM